MMATTHDDLENRMVIDRPEIANKDDRNLDDIAEDQILNFGLAFQSVAEDHGLFLLKELYELRTTDPAIKALKNKLHDYVKGEIE